MSFATLAAPTVTGTRAVSSPEKLTTSVCVPSGSERLNVPPRSATVPMLEPSTCTIAPGSGSPRGLIQHPARDRGGVGERREQERDKGDDADVDSGTAMMQISGTR